MPVPVCVEQVHQRGVGQIAQRCRRAWPRRARGRRRRSAARRARHDLGLRAGRLDELHRDRDAVRGRGADARGGCRRRPARPRRPPARRQRQARRRRRRPSSRKPPSCTCPCRKFIERRADEAGDEQVGRPVVELERRADLLDAAVVHHHDLVGHGHGLDLVVRDVDGGGA